MILLKWGLQGLYLQTPALLTNPGVRMRIALCAVQSLTIKGAKRDRQRKPGKEEKTAFVRTQEKNYFLVSSSLIMASTNGFKISRVTVCNTSGFIFARTLATISSMS